MKIRLALACYISLAMPASALTVTGPAIVSHPYAISLEGYSIYLLGVDSVERGQNCTIDRQQWQCWAAALRQLETIVSEGAMTCEGVVGPTADNRMIGSCTVNAEDVGERYVRSGFGLSVPEETLRYEAAQEEARAAGRGLWQGRFVPPADWRSMPTTPRSERPDFDLDAPVP